MISNDLIPPEIPKEIEDKIVDFAADKVSAPLVPSFIKKAYIRRMLEGTWHNLFQGRSGQMLMKIFAFIGDAKNWLSHKKTYLLAVSAMLYTLAGWSQGTIPSTEAAKQLYAELVTVTGRAAIGKSRQTPTPPQA